MLKHHAHRGDDFFDLRRGNGNAVFNQRFAIDEDGAAVCLLQIDEAAKQSGFAGTGGTDNGHDIAAIDCK